MNYQAFNEGFVEKCAAMGLDPKVIGALAGGGLGLGMGAGLNPLDNRLLSALALGVPGAGLGAGGGALFEYLRGAPGAAGGAAGEAVGRAAGGAAGDASKEMYSGLTPEEERLWQQLQAFGQSPPDDNEEITPEKVRAFFRERGFGG